MRLELILKDILRRPYHLSKMGWLKNYLLSQGKRDAVFIWIPKVAGTSVYHALSEFGCMKLKTIDQATHMFPQRGIVTFGHMAYQELVRQKIVNQKFHKSSFKFCFVRNPYDRAVSLYSMLLKNHALASDVTFRGFCNILQENNYEDIGLYNLKGLSQCNPQTKWITDDNGHIFVDFIGRLESIHEDFGNLLSKFNIHTKLEMKNKGKRTAYQGYYNSETRKIIRRVYEEDFDLLKYEFYVSSK